MINFFQLFQLFDSDKYINVDTDVVTSLTAIDPLMVDWTQGTCGRSFAEVMKTSGAAAEKTNQPEDEPEIVADEDENRKITAAEALKKFELRLRLNSVSAQVQTLNGSG